MPETMPGIYARQESLDLCVPKAAIVVGCGGVGFWVATFLAMSGVQHLVLVDFDHVEESNLNRIALLPSDIGKPKAEVLKEWVLALRPELNVYAVHGRLGDDVSLNEIKLLFPTSITRSYISLYDCTDRIGVQQLLYDECQRLGIRRIRAGYDGGDHITITELPPARWGDQEDDGGYDVTPSWVVPAVLAAAMAVAKEERSIEQEASASIADLFRRV